MQIRSFACVATVLLVFAGSAPTAIADPIVVTFDDLSGDNQPVPTGYGGIDWLGGWTHYGFDQEPYTPRSAPQRIYATGGANGPLGTLHERQFNFVEPNQFFSGAWFAGQSTLGGTGAGEAFVQFRLYDDGLLVHTSASLRPTGNPTFLGAGYSGFVDRVGVFSNNAGYWVMDNVTYGGEVAPVPEPATLLLLGAGLAGVGLRRRMTA